MISVKPKPHIPSIAQFVISGLGMLSVWGLALVYLVIASVQVISGEPKTEASSLFIVAIDFIVLGLLILPSVVFSLMRMINRPLAISTHTTTRFLLAIILIWPLILYLGNLFNNAGSWGAYLFPITQVVAVLLLVFWFYTVASMGLEKTSPQRNWGLLASGMIGGTGLSIVLELLGAILFLAGFVALVFLIPNLQDEISRLATRISTVGTDMDALMRIFTPYLSKTAVVITLILSTSVVIPLMEEALKPIGLWFLSRKELSPAQGFMGGVISGAGFAIVESLFNTTQVTGDSWILVSTMRFGTTLMHMLASGLVGWGLASAWSQRKYLRLAGAYLGAVLLHGVWNGLAITFTLSQLSPGLTSEALTSTGKLTLAGLGVWTVVGLVLFLFMNSHLRKKRVELPENQP